MAGLVPAIHACSLLFGKRRGCPRRARARRVRDCVSWHGRGRQSQSEWRTPREWRALVGRQRPARHPAGGVRDVRGPARALSVRDTGRRGRAAPALDQPRALSGAGRASAARHRAAAGAGRKRRRAPVSAPCRGGLVVQGEGRRQGGALRRSRLAARLCARCAQFLFRVPGDERQGRAAGASALPGLDPHGEQRAAAAHLSGSARPRQDQARLRGGDARRDRHHRGEDSRARARHPVGLLDRGAGTPMAASRVFRWRARSSAT